MKARKIIYFFLDKYTPVLRAPPASPVVHLDCCLTYAKPSETVVGLLYIMSAMC